ncbi:chaperone NapD [Aporhodopirellula aestuarii]|uniref:Chaperone NapD n=1 Tax=Aporhodopirellula aestuarii TaxID=2950107 RepID=A0ABT0U692_9BACT|nr:chaperone NapD [Aporhodopirellula aestuarii]MCM2372189.1 chaperone NapD [Aporhodopirellula aestuarii]
MPVSGLVVTFQTPVDQYRETIELLRAVPEIETGEFKNGKLAIVVDSETRHRDQEIWDSVRQMPGVIDLAVAFVGFDDDQNHTRDE